jgi:hypothetical protein
MFDASRPGMAIVAGGLTVALLDGLDAVIFFGSMGVRPARIFQSIAAGVVGREAAVAGGLATAALGVVLHCIIGILIVTAAVAIVRTWPGLIRSTPLFALLFGISAYLVMNLVVVPASAITPATWLPSGAVLANGVLIHIFGVGLPSAIAARAAVGRAQ